MEYGVALDILKKDVQGAFRLKNLQGGCEVYFYLRESLDFSAALDRLRNALRRKGLALLDIVPSPVILYRGLEMLLEHGFASPLYQRLLRKHLYRAAIENACDLEVRSAFEASAASLAINAFAPLFEARTYLSQAGSLQMSGNPELVENCLTLLQQYVAYAKQYEKAHRHEHVRTSSPMEAAYKLLMPRVVLFCLQEAGKNGTGRQVLYDVAKQEPHGLAGNPTGEGLWLQRLAAVKLYDIEGFDSFRKYLTTLRATHYYNINLVRGFSREQLQVLLADARAHPEADQTDCNIVLSEWLALELAVV
jgi:hypothetical protein